jgi:hypothetical protein
MKKSMSKYATLISAAALAIGLLSVGPSAHAANADAELTLNFVGVACEGCTVTYQPANADSQMEKIKNDSVTFTSANGPLQAGYFLIDNPKFADLGAATAISLQYKGKIPGQKISRTRAIDSKRASVCWAGTDSQNSLRVRLSTVKDTALTGKSTKAILAWAQPTPTGAKGPTLRTNKGRVMANGDLGCSL